ncbi:AraC family transcriptional regulator [Mucilaginibacter mali]|uniref:AraC family transcriptional regulator n=1 Tax=Mucilaginibacter mali TaxID=2740462 RepID=A0A7D4UBP1_9SPHI|nr:helix-turn-helix domain-containing protein [Mucilaginibacter mali]QKJ30958.1 AraC family transcriptional regulator [Mucilaginibacter mali]
MSYIRIQPHPQLEQLIECYWMVESDDPAIQTEKIIPDGFTELIFHYGDLYRANISGQWQTQGRHLLAGQIGNYFYLENTGKAKMIAIKLKPAALTQLFGLQMSDYTDRVVTLDTIPNRALQQLQDIVLQFEDEQQVKEAFDTWLLPLSHSVTTTPVTAAIDLIFKQNGMVTVKEMTEAACIGERQLERLFKRYVGLTPKYYARIIRFNYIFQIVQSKSASWADVVYQAGYYDQSHFIRDFKAFTGEDPSAYYFDADNMANFFLNK